MANPFDGILINDKYYNHEIGSYKRTYPLKNSAITNQNNRTFQILGADLPTHSITLILENDYTVYSGNSNVGLGNTSWKGVSRLADLVSMLGDNGASLPLTLVCPDGSSHLVVPTGALDFDIFKDPVVPTGIEYRVNLTFENYS